MAANVPLLRVLRTTLVVSLARHSDYFSFKLFATLNAFVQAGELENTVVRVSQSFVNRVRGGSRNGIEAKLCAEELTYACVSYPFASEIQSHTAYRPTGMSSRTQYRCREGSKERMKGRKHSGASSWGPLAVFKASHTLASLGHS
jgi:hypothetical protein